MALVGHGVRARPVGIPPTTSWSDRVTTYSDLAGNETTIAFPIHPVQPHY